MNPIVFAHGAHGAVAASAVTALSSVSYGTLQNSFVRRRTDNLVQVLVKPGVARY